MNTEQNKYLWKNNHDLVEKLTDKLQIYCAIASAQPQLLTNSVGDNCGRSFVSPEEK